jgi:hypothetical protein
MIKGICRHKKMTCHRFEGGDQEAKFFSSEICTLRHVPSSEGRQARLRALPRIHIVDDHDRPGCVLRLAEINSPEKEQEHFAFLRFMNLIMGKDLF